jgi:hypothetical protein
MELSGTGFERGEWIEMVSFNDCTAQLLYVSSTHKLNDATTTFSLPAVLSG